MSELDSKAVAEIVDLARVPLKTMTAIEGGVPFIMIPKDYKLETLLPYVYNDQNATPIRKSGTAKVHDAASLIEYVTCGAHMTWVQTKTGKKMPMNVDGTLHFATCPKADQFRKPAEARA